MTKYYAKKEHSEMDSIVSGQNLVQGLRKFHQDQWPQFCDFHIKCQDEALVPASRMLLYVSSGYFQAFFRQTPDAREVNMIFDSTIMKLVIKSIIHPHLDEIEADVMDVVKVADYLQINDLLTIGSKLLAKNLSKNNLAEMIDLIHSVHLPMLEKAIVKFIQKNIQSDFVIPAITSLPKDKMSLVFKHEPGLIVHDAYGRRYDTALIIVMLLNAYYDNLKSLGKLDSFDYLSLYGNKLLDGHWEETTQPLWVLQWIFQTDFDIASNRVKALRPGACGVSLDRNVHELMKKQLDNAVDLPSIPDDLADLEEETPFVVRDSCEYNNRKSFGTHPDSSEVIDEWNIEGNIRKINVKTRLWGDSLIVQGIQVFLDDGTCQAFGMDLDDKCGVKSLIVPDGQHIKTMNFRSGWYIDAIGFETSTGEVTDFIGGDGGSLWNRNDYRYGRRHHFLRGFQGKTVMAQNVPCICDVQLSFSVIGDDSRMNDDKYDFEDTHDYAQFSDNPDDY